MLALVVKVSSLSSSGFLFSILIRSILNNTVLFLVIRWFYCDFRNLWFLFLWWLWLGLWLLLGGLFCCLDFLLGLLMLLLCLLLFLFNFSILSRFKFLLYRFVLFLYLLLLFLGHHLFHDSLLELDINGLNLFSELLEDDGLLFNSVLGLLNLLDFTGFMDCNNKVVV